MMLQPELEALAAELRSRLGPDGWTVTVTVDLGGGRPRVALRHPLVPGEHVVEADADRLAARLHAHLATWPEIRRAHQPPIRPERRVLVRKLRDACWWPRGLDAVRAVRDIAWALAAEGVLNHDEAAWLDEAVEPGVDQHGTDGTDTADADAA